MLKLFRRAAVLTVFVAAACGDSTGPGDVAGTYDLRQVNSDQTSPFLLFQDGDDRLELVSGEFIVRTDGTFRSTLVVRETFGGTTFPDDESIANGTYTLDDNDITFEEDGTGEFLDGRISGNNLIIEQPGVRLVFTR
jgi:hypothetical protein